MTKRNDTAYGNLIILQSLSDLNNYEMDKFIERVTLDVYALVNDWITEYQFILDGCAETLGLECEITVEQKTILRNEILSMTKMNESNKNVVTARRHAASSPQDQSPPEDKIDKFGSKDILPIVGLIIARIHLIVCDHQMCLNFWGCPKLAGENKLFTRTIYDKKIVTDPERRHQVFTEFGMSYFYYYYFRSL